MRSILAIIGQGRNARAAAIVALVAAAFLVLGRFGSSAPPTSPNPVPRFETDLLPLFRAKCLRCHSGKSPKGELDLSTPVGLLKGGESGPVVKPGKPKDSSLFEKVLGGSMPPGKKDRASEAEIAMLQRWIETGTELASASKDGDARSATALTQHDVFPILLRRCTVCHGPRLQEGGLDLRTTASMLRGGKSGPAIVPGKPEESLLIKKIRSAQMPPLRRIIEVSIKPIEPAETALLARWIELGAPEVPIQPDVATTQPDPLVTNKDRDFWAFQPPRPVPVPMVRHPEQVANPIDAFVLKALEDKGLTISAEADRPTLMRRVYLDLTGLLPEPAEVEAFLTDRAPNAYERLVDRLLASPRHGERWARHWLDLAGYAESEGKTEQDLARPFAYRYRDYVIRSFNADKPYDRFLHEQIAGDELADVEHGTEITQEMEDNLVATGFLRQAPDPTWSNPSNFIPDRLEVMADEIEVLSSAVLGLTMKCARCHNHKFDPIPQRDYYRLVAVFHGAFDEHDWMRSNWHGGLSMGPRSDRDLAQVAATERRQWQAQQARLQKEINALRETLDQYRKSGKPDADVKKRTEETDQRIRALEAQRLPEPKIRALWDRGEPSPTYIYRRGDYLSPGRLVGPGVPSVLTDGKTPFAVQPPWPGAKKTGRRLALARWLTEPDQPLTARVMVNRVWRHHFGVGLVKTLDNFGKTGARPTHPELLDWLARAFVHQGWSLKALHRLMVTSATYRQGSGITPSSRQLDPENVLYSRRLLQRMSAEQLYDTMLLAAGRLDDTPFGPADALGVRGDGLVTPVARDHGWRRGIYLQQQRKVVATHLENFDYPQMNPNCIDRRDSIVAPQALHLLNNGMVQQLAGHFAKRVREDAGADPEKQIDRVYWVALSRPPSAEEKDIGLFALARLTRQWAKRSPEANAAAEQALTTYCHAILNSAEFLYID